LAGAAGRAGIDALTPSSRRSHFVANGWDVALNSSAIVKHRRIDLDGLGVFYREAGPADAPVILLPHGYPCSSYEFRNFMPPLADRWRLIAPDFPGCGYSDTPEDFDYSFDGYAAFLEDFTARLGVERYVLYLHDFGSQIGLRLAIRSPERIAGLIIQNGDIYEDQLGPKYAPLEEYWRNPTSEGRAKLAEAVSEEGFKDEFLNDVRDELSERIPPDLWKLHWSLMTPKRREIAVSVIAALKENLAWFPKYQAYLREHQPPTLIVWGPQDGYMPEGSARAYLRDLPNAELHLLDGGHWALETNLDEIVALSRDFLSRTLTR
jgi:pimeloyl-ACP methyl ester carboxylesterase